MIKELLESIGITKEVRIAIYSTCVTATVIFFAKDKYLYPEHNAVISQCKADIDALKTANQKQEKLIEEYSATLQKGNTRINELTQEVEKLRPYERATPEWRTALNNERTNSKNFQDQLNQANQLSKDLRQTAEVCAGERSDLKTTVSKYKDLVANYTPLIDRRNEIRQIEKSKEAAEVKLMELQGSAINRQFYPEQIMQLTRLTSEYHQQILQLRQCSR